ncbi:MAG: S9 family peptidase, partial [Bacteroidota bacterium]
MKSKQILSIFFFICLSAVAQQKITVEEIYSGAFRAKGMDELQSLQNTNQYTVLNFDRATRTMQIDLYDFATLNKVTTLIDTKNHEELSGGIDSYTFSPDEKMILIASGSNQIFRPSFPATYWVFNIG